MANKNQLPTASGGQQLGSTPIYNPTVPFVYKYLKSLESGKIFYISGIPSKNPKRFNINLMSGQDIAFHFDIRICYGDFRNVIVRNTRLSNRWGQTERTLNGPFPFKEDEFFEIVILIESASFKTQLPSGGRHFGSTALYNPAVPFVHTLGTVEAGKMFYISGITSQNPKRITINFDSGQDVAFHFDIRFCVGNDSLSLSGTQSVAIVEKEKKQH
ncbi:galectin-4-like [Mercenaria mercenaria]|uniref:galectin-4-like n=1 Tax=Mercenaria mercenaria TaxID=6596 RepID=UPI00234E37E5|nr:galectin-4-like [Mercenaria mercenaria]